jgi:hypothetical protein
LMTFGDGFFDVDAAATASKTDLLLVDLVSSCADLAKRHLSYVETMHGIAFKPTASSQDAVRFPMQPELSKHARTLHAMEAGVWRNAHATGALIQLSSRAVSTCSEG